MVPGLEVLSTENSEPETEYVTMTVGTGQPVSVKVMVRVLDTSPLYVKLPLPQLDITRGTTWYLVNISTRTKSVNHPIETRESLTQRHRQSPLL